MAKLRFSVKPRWFRKPLVIVQIAEMRPYNFDPATDIQPGGYSEHWRDATPADLMPDLKDLEQPA